MESHGLFAGARPDPKMEPGVSPMMAIRRGLEERYPLVRRMIVCSAGDEKAEGFPLFFNLFLAAMENRDGAPCCFVLPWRGQMARLATILLGLSILRREFNSLARAYAEQKFENGQKVRVYPSKHVFVFSGFWPGQPDKFRLSTLDGSGHRTFPASDVLRLEPTSLIRPIGRLDTRILEPQPSPLDLLLDIPMFGNPALLRNRVLCLDEQNRFAEFAVSHRFKTKGSDEAANLVELLPFAWIREGNPGCNPVFENWTARFPHTEPLVGVTSSCERVAEACRLSPRRSKVVVVNGLQVLSNPQAFDEIAASQRLVLFADYSEEDRMRDLDARGCRFWVFSERELFDAGDVEEEPKGRGGVFETVVRRARNFLRLRIEPAACENETLNTIALKLEELRPELDSERETNPSGRLGPLARRLWRTLNEAAAKCGVLSAVEREQFANELSGLRAELTSALPWLRPETVTNLRTVLEAFQALFGISSELGIRKGEVLRRTIEAARSSNPFELALVTRTESQARLVAGRLYSSGIERPVFSLTTIPDNTTFDQVIVLSWPGSDSFRQLAASSLTSHIILLCYDFEARWLRQCERRFSQQPALTAITAKEKEAFVSCQDARLVWPEDSKPGLPPPPLPAPVTFDVWNYEQRLKSFRKGGHVDALPGAKVPAKYVSFIGNGYALLTRWHKLPVATRLLSTDRLTGQSLPERVVEGLRPGDLVVFPEGGQTAIIAQMADKLIVSDAPALRKQSKLWREALRSSDLSPEQFQHKATAYGCTRHIATVRNWFYDEEQIGPGERQDLDLIAIITESDELDAAANDVWEAITFLRSKHVGAGSVLRATLLEQLSEALPAVEENGSRIEVPNLGVAWVVEIDAIASAFTEEVRGQVDRLLWDDRS